ncbi:MAG: MFS transporter [Proteobacteria bacterium]|nr:MFS transporter [Pseudomonadota bacterium]MDA1057838.1 MFS transporter [Pseudomonadota bacterium]
MKLSAFGGIGRALSNRDYRVYTYGSSASLIGTWMQRAAVGWLAWELTHDPKWVGIVVSADLLPSIVASPIAGVLADRLHPMRMLKVLQVLAALQALALAVMTFGGFLTVELLTVMTLLLGVIMGFNHPVRQTMIYQLVRREDLSAAVATTSVIFNTSRVIGPAIAGFVIHFGGAGIAFSLNAVTFMVMLGALAAIKLPPQAPRPRSSLSVVGDIMAGYRYAFAHKGIAPTLLISLSAALLVRPAVEMLPAFVGQVFAGGADSLGLILAANGVGAMLSGIWLAWRGSAHGLVAIAIWSTVLSAVALAGFAASSSFWVGTGFIFLLGIAMSLRGTATQTLIQNAVDPSMRGRVLSLNTLIFNVGPAAGAFSLGLIASWAGLQPPLYVAAALSLAVWLWAWLRGERLTQYLEGPDTHEGRGTIPDAPTPAAPPRPAE